MSIPHLGQGIFGYRTESKTPYNATRNQCVNAIVTTAMSYVGNTPYVRDYSCAPGVGVDCSGLVMQALCAMGMDLSPMNLAADSFSVDLVCRTLLCIFK